MKLTESLLRSIIKEELKNVLNLSERLRRVNQYGVPLRGITQDGVNLSGSTRPPRGPRDFLVPGAINPATGQQGPRRHQTEEEFKISQQPSYLTGLLKKLKQIDSEYMDRFTQTSKFQGLDEIYLASFVGKDFRKAVQDLANQYEEGTTREGRAMQDTLLTKFKEIAKKYAPIRAGEGFVSGVARAASPIYSPSTQE